MAAALLQSLVKNHPFVDGNKRTAYYSTKRLLSKNQLELTANKQAVLDFMMTVDTQNKSLGDIATWLEKHSRS
jgi:death-on-curing protein